MPAVIDKALDFIGAMDVSAPTPSSMNESTAKGIFKYPEYFSTYMQEELKALV